MYGEDLPDRRSRIAAFRPRPGSVILTPLPAARFHCVDPPDGSEDRMVMRSPSFLRRIGLLHLASVVLPLLGLVAWGHFSWRVEQARASALAEKNVEIAREYLLRAIQAADSALGQAELVIRGLSWDEIATPEVHQRLKEIAEGSDLPWGIALIDPNGRLRNSTTGQHEVDLSDRPYFTALRDGHSGIYIGHAVMGRTSGEQSIPVARRRKGEGFDGVIVVSVRAETLISFFEKLKIDDQTIASVAKADGGVLARSPPIPPVVLGPETPFMRAIARSNSGTYAGTAGADGVERTYAFAQVGDLPLYAVYGFSLNRVVEHWRHDMYIAGAFALLGAILLWIAGNRAVAVRRHRDELAAQVEARTAELRSALAEKNVLLREVHHRVKNNLSMIVAMVRIVGRGAPADAQGHFRDIAARISAVGRIYSQIHARGDLSVFDAAAYLREVCTEISRAFGSDRIRMRVDIAPADIDVDTALPLGLIVSELVTNALKHAFVGREGGDILVRLRQEDGVGILTVRDNGQGLPATVRPSASGLGLVEVLARQIDGAVSRKTRPEGGAQFRVTFKVSRRETGPSRQAA